MHSEDLNPSKILNNDNKKKGICPHLSKDLQNETPFSVSSCSAAELNLGSLRTLHTAYRLIPDLESELG